MENHWLSDFRWVAINTNDFIEEDIASQIDLMIDRFIIAFYEFILSDDLVSTLTELDVETRNELSEQYSK